MKFGTGSNTELTQKYETVKVQMTNVHPHIYILKQISPILNLTPLYSVSLTSLARQIARVTVLFKVVCMSSAIEITLVYAVHYLNCFMSAINPE